MITTFPDNFGKFDAFGWLESARQSRSPNFSIRPTDAAIDLIVIHNISLPPAVYGGHYIEDLFLNQLEFSKHPYFERLENLRVSAHFLIRRNGELIQFVSAKNAAWHAGKSIFNGKEKCNDFSLGIELEGTDEEPFTEIQYEVLTGLTKAIQNKYPIKNIVGHEHIAPERKTDPGPFFDWEKYINKLSPKDKFSLFPCAKPDNRL